MFGFRCFRCFRRFRVSDREYDVGLKRGNNGNSGNNGNGFFSISSY